MKLINRQINVKQLLFCTCSPLVDAIAMVVVVVVAVVVARAR